MAKIWDNPLMNIENLDISSNQNKHQTKNPLRRLLLNNFNKVLKSAITGNSLPQSLLEIGCGEGYVLDYIEKNVDIPIKMGIDISQTALEKAKKLLPKSVFISADLSSENFSQTISKFNMQNSDLVICLEVLEHIRDYEKAIQNLKNIPAETFIISVPNEPFFRLSNLIALKNVRSLGNDPEHINNWSINQFRNLLKKHFVINKSYYPFPWQMYLCKKKN